MTLALALLADLVISGSVVTLQATTAPGAVAEVVFQNVELNGPGDDGAYALSDPALWPEGGAGGLSLTLGFRWDGGWDGADSLRITPPAGLICAPADCTLTVPEGGTATLLLIEWVGF